MTRPRVVSVHRGGFRPHYDPPRPGDAAMFAALAEASHSRNPGDGCVASSAGCGR